MTRRALTNRWAVLALVFVTRLALPLQFQSVAAVAPFLRTELGFSFSQLGTLMGLYSLPGVLLALPSGLLGDRIGARPTLLGGLALMVAGGVLMTAGGSYPLMVAARLVTGTGAILVMVQTQALLTAQFAGKELATALAIGASAFGLGIGVAMGVLSPLAELGGWRMAVNATTALAGLCGALVALLLPDPAQSAARPEGQGRLWALTAREAVLCAVAGVGQVGFVTGYVVFMSFAPLVLVAAGQSVAAAGVLVGQAALVAIVSVPLGGYLVDRTGRKDTLIAGGALGTALCCLAFPLWGPPLLWVLLFGALRGGVTGGIQSLPGEVLAPSHRSTGFGVYYTMHYLGLVIGPALAGRLLDATGLPAASVWLAAAIWLSILPMLAAFRLLQRRWAPLPTPAPAAAD